MPNPFPGMDPYLEGDLWTTVHTELASEIARQLAPKLRPKYAVLPSRRIVLVTPDETELPAQRIPDVGVVSHQTGQRVEATGLAVAPLVANAVTPEPTPQVTVEIRDRAGRSLVTAIEVLSPTNKRGDWRDEYFDNRNEYLRSTAHLVEIDLVRVGDRFPVDSRCRKRPTTRLWPGRTATPGSNVGRSRCRDRCRRSRSRFAPIRT